MSAFFIVVVLSTHRESDNAAQSWDSVDKNYQLATKKLSNQPPLPTEQGISFPYGL